MGTQEYTMPSTTTKTAQQVALTSLVKGGLARKDFTTGTKGFHGQDKIEIGGQRYQAQISAFLIGSKTDPKARVLATVDQMKTAVIAELINKGVPAKTFGSGSTGYRTQGKVQVGDESYQVQVQAVLIGSKREPQDRPGAPVVQLAA
jgi:hypothetical protein